MYRNLKLLDSIFIINKHGLFDESLSDDSNSSNKSPSGRNMEDRENSPYRTIRDQREHLWIKKNPTKTFTSSGSFYSKWRGPKWKEV